MKTYGILPLNDLEEISQRFAQEFQELSNVNFVVVGASGFLGRWIATSLSYMRSKEQLHGQLYFVVRDKTKISELESSSILLPGSIVPTSSMDSSSFRSKEDQRTVVIYAASSTSNSGKLLDSNAELILNLPKRILKCLGKQEVTFIHLSSGGVYVPASRIKSGIERDEKVQSTSRDFYIAEKLILEQWLQTKNFASSVTARNPRLFAFYGPGLQLDRHFAIGEFMKAGSSGTPICVSGNPGNLRSYLHARDAVHQILSNCLVSEPTNSQIGSTQVMDIETVARVVAREYSVPLNVINAGSAKVDNYVPLDSPSLPEKDFELGISEWREWLELS